MSPVSATVGSATEALLRDTQLVLWFSVGVLILAVGLVYWLTQKVENGCPSCAHCKDRRAAKEDEQRRLREEYERRFGVRRVEDDEDDPKPPQ